MFKKLLSVILTISIVASLFVSNTLFANAADASAAATETTNKVVVSHYTASSMRNAAGIQSLVEDGDVTVGTTVLNSNLANSAYTYTKYINGTPTDRNEDSDMKNAATTPYSNVGGFGNDFKYTATETVGGTACATIVEGRDSKGYYQIYKTGTNNNVTNDVGIEYLDIANTDENARRKIVMEYNIGSGNEITDIVLADGANQYRMGYFVVMSSTNGKQWTEIYRNTADTVVGNNIKNASVLHIKLNKPILANYVQIHVYASTNSVFANEYNSFFKNGVDIRLQGLQVFGRQAFTYNDHGTNSGTSATTYDKTTLTDKYNSEVLGAKKGSLISGIQYPTVTYYVNSQYAAGTKFDLGDGVLDTNYTYDEPSTLELSKLSSDFPKFTNGQLFDGDLGIGRSNSVAIRRMFINKNDDAANVSATDLIDDETKQWIQMDYEFSALANVSTLALIGNLNTRYNASHYKYYLSETREGLYDEENCVAEVTTAASIGNVTLTTPKKAKYVGLRLVCAHNTLLNPNLRLDNTHPRQSEFSVFGSYVAPADANITCSVDGGVPNSVVTMSDPSYSGIVDQDGKYATGTVTLTAEAEYTDGAKYEFTGWYANEQLYSTDASVTYDLTKDDIALVAKYTKITYILSDNDTAANNDNAYTADALREQYNSLIAGKKGSLIKGIQKPTVTYYVNSQYAAGTSFDLGEGVLDTNYTYDEPTALSSTDVANDMPNFTDGNYFGSDASIARATATSKAVRYMFINNYSSADNLVMSDFINDENNRWIQLDYALDAEATISALALIGKATNRFNIGHYKYYLADTKEGLYNEENCVAEVESSACIATVTLSEPKTAKYIGLRIICGYNPLMNLNLKGDNRYVRLGDLDVFGSYTNPIDAEVVTTTEDGVPSALISQEDAVYSGIADQDGNYPSGTVKVTASETYKDTENKLEYTFKGWYVGNDLISANADYTYNLIGGDATLIAKYDVAPLVNKYTLSFIDATKNVIGTIVVEEGAIPSVDDVNAINSLVKDIYGYTVYMENEMVVWDNEVFVEITADMTFNACYKQKDFSTMVTLYKTDSTEYFYKENQRFDTAITLAYEGANSWLDASDNVMIAASTGTLYACGNAMDIYAKSASVTTPDVTIVGKDTKNGNFTVFAHAAPVADVKAYGIIFASNTYKTNYDKQTDKGDMFTLNDTEAINKASPSLKVSEVKVTNNANVDFMATLNGCDGKVRHARAYVTYADGTTVYSDVIVANN